MCYKGDDIFIHAVFYDVSVENMIKCIYPNFITHYKCSKYLSNLAILFPTNHTLGHLNLVIVDDTILRETFTYFDIEEVEDFGGTCSHLNISALPPHDLN